MNNEEKAMKENPAIGRSWEEVRKELFTPEEIAESDLRVALIGEIITPDRKKGSVRKSWRNSAG